VGDGVVDDGLERGGAVRHRVEQLGYPAAREPRRGELAHAHGGPGAVHQDHRPTVRLLVRLQHPGNERGRERERDEGRRDRAG